MQTIPEQISSATRAPIEAQLELFGSIAVAAVENTGRLALLQIEASRSALDQACTAWRQLLAGGGQNLFAPMPRTPASQADRPEPANPVQPPTLREADVPSGHHDQASADADNTPVQVQQPVAEPHAAEPPAPRNPIAEAAAQVAPDRQPGVPLAAAPVTADSPVALPKLKPLESAPPTPSYSQRKGVPRK